MTPAARHLLLLLIGLTLPWSAGAESRMVTGQGGASAALDFRIVVPAIVRVLGNQHPSSITLADASARQELEVLTTLRQGFCAVLRLNTSGIRDWSLHSSSAGVQILRTAEGYRVCAPRNGRHRIALEHRFSVDIPLDRFSTAGALPWPVQTELSAI